MSEPLTEEQRQRVVRVGRVIGYCIGAVLLAVESWVLSLLAEWAWRAVANPGCEVSRDTFFVVIATLLYGRALFSVARATTLPGES